MQPPHPPEQHIADMAWLARVARALVHDPATAEDLAQDTWIAALRRRARGEEAGRGWLARAVRGRLWNLRRDEQRRANRERDVAREEALPSTNDLVERAELQARLANALAAFAAPTTDTLVALGGALAMKKALGIAALVLVGWIAFGPMELRSGWCVSLQ